MFRFRDSKGWSVRSGRHPFRPRASNKRGHQKSHGSADAFAELDKGRLSAVAGFRKLKAAADTYGKRSIICESGQHVIAPDGLPIVAHLERDPEIGRIYDRYLAGLKTAGADLIMTYSHTGGISQYGSWGIREFASQPISETPKRRAVLDAIAKP